MRGVTSYIEAPKDRDHCDVVIGVRQNADEGKFNPRSVLVDVTPVDVGWRVGEAMVRTVGHFKEVVISFRDIPGHLTSARGDATQRQIGRAKWY